MRTDNLGSKWMNREVRRIGTLSALVTLPIGACAKMGDFRDYSTVCGVASTSSMPGVTAGSTATGVAGTSAALTVTAGSTATGISGTSAALAATAGSTATGTAGTSSMVDATAGSTAIGMAGTSAALRVPACREMTWGPVDNQPESLVARWQFEDPKPEVGAASTWLDDAKIRALASSTNGTEAAHPSTVSLRPSPAGHSLELAGDQYAVFNGSSTDAIFSSSFTVGASVSLDRRELDVLASQYQIQSPTPIVPVISTLDTGCGGYQLGFRRSQAGLELVFAYRSLASDQCTEQLFTHALERAVWKGEFGGFHYIAASVNKLTATGETRVVLFWDGVTAATPLGDARSAPGTISYQDYDLYLGANRASPSAQKQPPFVGLVDDVSVFVPPLNENELRDYVQSSFTAEGPSGCRWGFGSAYADANAPALIDIADDSSSQALRFSVESGSEGIGWAMAQLAWLGAGRNMIPYDKAYLKASIPEGQKFSFAISSGHAGSACNWHRIGKGGVAEYEFDLAHPNVCTSPNCVFDIRDVMWASVQSAWEPRGTATKKAAFEIDALEFGVASTPTIDPLTYGGAFGPNGWCWRPIAYEAGGYCDWNGSPSARSVAAILGGSASTSTRLAADFESRPLDLSGCRYVELDLLLEVQRQQETKEPCNDVNQLALTDTIGRWTVWHLVPQSQSSTYVVDLDSQPNAPPSLNERADHKSIGALSIQKPWCVAGELNATVQSIRLVDANHNPGCEKPSSD